eukprot:scaffold143187_cov53-Cyclotella_meneghiniana.AAC.2
MNPRNSAKSSLKWPTLAVQFNDFSAELDQPTTHGGVLSDLGRHGLESGDELNSPFFPLVYPRFDEEEAKARDAGEVGRNFQDIIQKIGGLAGSASGAKFRSFFQVLGSNKKHPFT